ncbi:transmembrane protein KIAA1109-like [Diaphorina citri]|uniref:Transmembrane protein KIAA1109-like n=1 Tax=Diaphorina citri TaxID=121845 RepID=A0A3Q0J2Z9_DIACI|nr:transmembrane protein KIAA1109-like [Diaphorina citri]
MTQEEIQFKTGSLKHHRWTTLHSIPEETIISPHILEFLEQTLEPIPAQERLGGGMHAMFDLGSDDPAPMPGQYVYASFPVDVIVYFHMQPSTFRFSCLPVSRVACLLQLPSLHLVFSSKRAEGNTCPEQGVAVGGLSITGCLADFSVYIFHPYGGKKTAGTSGANTSSNTQNLFSPLSDTERKDSLSVNVEFVKLHLSRSRSLTEQARGATIRFSTIVDIGSASFKYDMRRLTEILAFPKAWYRRNIMRRMFLGGDYPTRPSTSVFEPSDFDSSPETELELPLPKTSTPKSDRHRSDLPRDGSLKSPIHSESSTESATSNWNTLVLFAVNFKRLNVHMNMGNVMGNVMLLTKDFRSEGRLSVGSTGHKNLFISLGLGGASLDAKGGIVGGTIEISKVDTFILIKEDPSMEPEHTVGVKLWALELRLDYMGTGVVMTRVSSLEVSLRDEWRVKCSPSGGSTPTRRPALIFLHGNLKWDQLQLMISKSTSTAWYRRNIMRRMFLGGDYPTRPSTSVFEPSAWYRRNIMRRMFLGGDYPTRPSTSVFEPSAWYRRNIMRRMFLGGDYPTRPSTSVFEPSAWYRRNIMRRMFLGGDYPTRPSTSVFEPSAWYRRNIMRRMFLGGDYPTRPSTSVFEPSAWYRRNIMRRMFLGGDYPTRPSTSVFEPSAWYRRNIMRRMFLGGDYPTRPSTSVFEPSAWYRRNIMRRMFLGGDYPTRPSTSVFEPSAWYRRNIMRRMFLGGDYPTRPSTSVFEPSAWYRRNIMRRMFLGGDYPTRPSTSVFEPSAWYRRNIMRRMFLGGDYPTRPSTSVFEPSAWYRRNIMRRMFLGGDYPTRPSTSVFEPSAWYRRNIATEAQEIRSHDVSEDLDVHIVETLTFSLGISTESPQVHHHSMATVCRLSRNVLFPPQFRTLHEWFHYAFACSEIDAVDRFPSLEREKENLSSSSSSGTGTGHSETVRSRTPKLLEIPNHTREVIFALPSLQLNFETTHLQSSKVPPHNLLLEDSLLKPLVECSFITEFEDHIFVTVDAEAFFFLHDLITSYIKENKDKVVLPLSIGSADKTPRTSSPDSPTLSSSSSTSTRNTSKPESADEKKSNQRALSQQKKSSDEIDELNKRDWRNFHCNTWHLEPTVRLLSWGGKSIEPYGVDYILQKLGFTHARTTIPKWMQRGFMDPLDKVLAVLLLRIVSVVREEPTPAPNRK